MTTKSNHHAHHAASELSTPTTDSELLKRANSLIKEEKHLEAARLLQTVKDPSQLQPNHTQLLDTARILQDTVGELLADPHDHWIRQGESHGEHDFTIYYRVQDGGRLLCRIDSPIPSKLLVPLLAVLQESSLYRTWIPSWTIPVRLGLTESEQLLHDSRGHQVIRVRAGVPWPMNPREALFEVQAVDDIDKHGFIVAKMTTLTDSSQTANFEVPPVAPGSERCDFDGAVLVRSCPNDHPNYAATRKKHPSDDILLVQFQMHVDAKMALVPQSFINFITRTALGVVWNMLLGVAEQVADGTRREHMEVISQKPDFYRWVNHRCDYMLHHHKPKEEQVQASHDNDQHWTLQQVLRMSI